jgi:ribosome-associated translation inhibitor RaiA
MSTGSEGTNRTIHFPGDTYARVQQAAVHMSQVEGRPVSVSEAVREAVADWLARHERKLARAAKVEEGVPPGQ